MSRFNRKNTVIGALVFIILVTIILIGVINNKNKEIDDFEIYLNEYKMRVENYILDENEEKYDALMEKSKQVMENKDKKNIDELKAGLEELENKIIENNINNLKKKVDDIKAIKVEKEEKKEEISTKLKEVEILIEEKNFKKANEELDVLNKNIKDILAAIEQEEIEKMLDKIDILISQGKLEESKLEINKLIKKNLNKKQKKVVDEYNEEILKKDLNKYILSKEELLRVWYSRGYSNDIDRKVQHQLNLQKELKEKYNVTSPEEFFDKCIINGIYQNEEYVFVKDNYSPTYFINDTPVYLFYVQFPEVRYYTFISGAAEDTGVSGIYDAFYKGTLYEYKDNKKIKVVERPVFSIDYV